ncbi:hypothetical protein [Streptomyces mobaraensis]|uniref:Secreted protein n=1 Tax=Streptomyces mobaraensis TaxID=35621 RepID=A0A5N5W6S7_STRMB|nr:hypothetical protein [Streptomyces mobaraensis]KAB7843781.1 hypothetical protein FRZ00_17730 [Streptomyces mobaraensis]
MRRMSTLVVTAAMAAGVVFTALPAQSAVASGITCNVAEMHQQITRLRDRANSQDRSGDHSGARNTRAEADALQRRMQWCIDADDNV